MRYHFLFLFFSLFFGGCNLYSSLDKPSGDTQILSAARACFDLGDYECASKYYGQLSSSASDTATGESAFELLAQSGFTMATFMSAIVSKSSSGGALITKLAGALTSTAGLSSRFAIFRAYQKVALISDTRTKGLVRFITATALTSELLAESARSSGKLLKTDIVSNPTSCSASKSDPIPFTVAGCNSPTGSVLVTGTTITLSTATDAEITGPSGNPTLFMVNAAINEMSTGINELDTQGKLGSSTGGFSTDVLTAARTALTLGSDAPVYRATLINLEIGE